MKKRRTSKDSLVTGDSPQFRGGKDHLAQAKLEGAVVSSKQSLLKSSSRNRKSQCCKRSGSNEESKKSSFVSLVPIILIFTVGLGFLFYPLLSNAYNDWIHNNLINSYEQDVEEMAPEDFTSWFESAENYNASLVGEGVPDAFAVHAEDADSAYLNQLNFRYDGVMGYIKIPRISVNLPIYHTTSDEVMQKGAGHLQGSALPVGGQSTHCVISAHRGLPSAAMFTDLDQLKSGDKFFLKVLDRTCEYEIDQIKVVLPDETSDLDVKKGEDYCTLVTCTPYGVNSHRLLVRGHRIPYDENDEAKEALNSTVGPFTNYAMWIFGSLAIVALFAIVVMKRSRERQQHERFKKQYGYTSKNDST